MLFVTETPDNIIDDLRGIWKYAALDKHVENENKKTPEEYIIILIKMWDYLDGLTKAAIESTIVELDGKIIQNQWDIIKEQDTEKIKRLKGEGATLKALRTNVEQYLVCRLEQDNETN